MKKDKVLEKKRKHSASAIPFSMVADDMLNFFSGKTRPIDSGTRHRTPLFASMWSSRNTNRIRCLVRCWVISAEPCYAIWCDLTPHSQLSFFQCCLVRPLRRSTRKDQRYRLQGFFQEALACSFSPGSPKGTFRLAKRSKMNWKWSDSENIWKTKEITTKWC